MGGLRLYSTYDWLSVERSRSTINIRVETSDELFQSVPSIRDH
ncbi:MAG: hypothetical protein WCA35_03495 [Kovacikia sp.]